MLGIIIAVAVVGAFLVMVVILWLLNLWGIPSKKRIFIEIIDISRKLLYPLILVSIILLIVTCAFYIFRCIPIFKTVTDKYDVLKDVLGIIFVIIATISIGIYLYLKKLIKESVEKDIDKRFSALEGKMEVLYGYMMWKLEDNDSAIEHTKKALEDYKLEVMDEIWAKNNLAYYYADGIKKKLVIRSGKEPIWSKEDEAKELAEYIYRKYDQYKKDYDIPTWVETYIFVKSRFTKGVTDKKNVRKEILDLIERKDLEPIKEDLQESLNRLKK